MTDIGVWTAQQVQEWLLEALTAAGEEWERDPEQSWEDVKRSLLQLLGVSGEEDHESVRRLVQIVEELPEEDRRPLLADRGRADELAAQVAAQTRQETSEGADVASSGQAEPVWDGERWLAWDAGVQQWVPMEAETAAEVAKEIYDTVLAEMIAEDPDIRKAIEDDPALAGELYAYALEKAR